VLYGWIGADLIGTADLTGKNFPGKLNKVTATVAGSKRD
jgi:hypothetical protein